jgi:S-adenosylmethionine hydrolase
MTNLITLTTDFGLIDGFVGVMKGVMLSINPDAQFVDITHDIAPQDVQQGAFLLANSTPYFPAAAIHICVVDPGVGSTRRPLAAQVGETFFVAPDNGVISLALELFQARANGAPRVFHLNNPRFWLPRVSNTFHGRDIFSPCAAHLSRGIPLEELGTPISDWVTLAPTAPARRDARTLVGRVIYIDRYGNIVSNITDADMKDFGDGTVRVQIAGRELRGLVRTYSDVARGELAALIGSPWKLEIAQREGNAAKTLGVQVGDEIVVRREA